MAHPRTIESGRSETIDPTSDKFAGSTSVLVSFASLPNSPRYCSATRSCTASKPPGSLIAFATSRMPSAVAVATARIAAAWRG